MLLVALLAMLATSVRPPVYEPPRQDDKEEARRHPKAPKEARRQGMAEAVFAALHFHERLAQSMPRRWISRAWGTSKSRATWPSDE